MSESRSCLAEVQLYKFELHVYSAGVNWGGEGGVGPQTKPSGGRATCVISIVQLPPGGNSNWLLQFLSQPTITCKVPQMVNMGHL